MKESTKDNIVFFGIFGLCWLIGVCFWFLIVGTIGYLTVTLGFVVAIVLFGIFIACIFGDDSWLLM